MEKNKEFYISPNLENDDLTETINCINEAGENIEIPVVKEIPLTIYLNKHLDFYCLQFGLDKIVLLAHRLLLRSLIDHGRFECR